MATVTDRKLTKVEALELARAMRWQPKKVLVEGEELTLKTAMDAKRVLALVLQKTYSGELPHMQG
jgi:hypothetical protein